MSRFGLVGGTYQAVSASADAQLTMNWQPEKIESGAGKAEIILVPSPGLSIFAQLPDTPLRGMWQVNTPSKIQRSFAVSGNTLFEVFSDGTNLPLGAVVNDGKPASMASSATQLMVASGGQGYCYTFSTGVLTGPIATIAGVTIVGYSDGFFVALIGDSARIYVSTVLDGTNWDPAQTAIVSVFPDDVISMIVDHREIFLFGHKQSQGYYDSGNTFPYDVIPGAYAEQGSGATFGTVKADNTVFWIGQDERGTAMAFRAQGYTPQRITTHAVEFAWMNYSMVSDAEGYSFQERGHTIIHWYFPTANKSWRYDISTGLWHEVGFWDEEQGAFTAHRSRCHMFAFGKHLVGDWNSGNIYQMRSPLSDGAGGWTFVTDFGNAIRRVRRAPYVGTAGVRNYFQSLEVMAEPGLGPIPPLDDGTTIYGAVAINSSGGSGTPKYRVRIATSSVAGHTYTITGTYLNTGSNPITIGIGDSGNNFLASTTISPNVLTNISVSFVATGGQLNYLIAAQNITDLIMLLGINPTATDVTAAGADIMAANGSNNFVTLWSAQGGATITIVSGQIIPGVPRDPLMMIRYSNDGAKTWSNERMLKCGRAGDYSKWLISWQLGSCWGSIGRVFELSTSDPIPWVLVDADLTASPAMSPQKRLAAELRERA